MLTIITWASVLAVCHMTLCLTSQSSSSYTWNNKCICTTRTIVVLYLLRDIVKASHLAPLDRKDILDTTRNQPWNSVVLGASRTDGKPTKENDIHPSTIASARVTNVQEFTREWRKLSRGPKLHQYQ